MGIGANEAESQWYDQKAKLMEQVLGPSHDMVMHAIVPFNVGGGLDLYFYTQHKPGTVFATMELSELPGTGSSNQCFRNYELLMFTREAFDHTATHKPETPFGRIFPGFNAILNNIALFSQQAQLNPQETCKFPFAKDVKLWFRAYKLSKTSSDPAKSTVTFPLLESFPIRICLLSSSKIRFCNTRFKGLAPN